jgi:hypothetical protein
MKELLQSQDHYLLPFDISPLIFKKLPHFWIQINQKLTQYVTPQSQGVGATSVALNQGG